MEIRSGVEKRSFPPLNAIIASSLGRPTSGKNSFKSRFRLSFKGTGASSDNVQFLNWASLGTDQFDDPNEHRTEKLNQATINPAFDQGECCGSCWAVAASTVFADRYAIKNDVPSIVPSPIPIMSCCVNDPAVTDEDGQVTFKAVQTPDCEIMSTYNDLKMHGDSNAMGMCSGGIPFAAGKAIQRNGLTSSSCQSYNSILSCSGASSLASSNQKVISEFSCNETLYDCENRMMMEEGTDPEYISASTGSPETYVQQMKDALVAGGPLTAGFMVLGDMMAFGMDKMTLGARAEAGSNMFNWDSTGKVYVPGAYDELWGPVRTSSVGGMTTLQIERKGSSIIVHDTGAKSTAMLGEIMCGFHAVAVVGWGELDLDYCSGSSCDSLQTIKSFHDKKEKIPFWIMRNSWGDDWPTHDYYKSGVKVRVGSSSAEETIKLPPGFWLHAMYPNMSMAVDVPISYEGVDYGATMVMEAEKDFDQVNSTQAPESTEGTSVCVDDEWKDSEGMTCKQYVNSKWCTSNGKKGTGWKSNYGEFTQFSTEHGSAVDVCCECGGKGMSVKPEVPQEGTSVPKDESEPSTTVPSEASGGDVTLSPSATISPSVAHQMSSSGNFDNLGPVGVGLMIFGVWWCITM